MMLDEYFKLIDSLIATLKNAEFDCVVGVMRGGYIPAEAISRKFKKPLCVARASSYKNGKRAEFQFDGIVGDLAGTVLLVDDLIDTGETIINLSKYISNNGHDVKTAVIWNKQVDGRGIEPDYYAIAVPGDEWIVQPMEIYDDPN